MQLLYCWTVGPRLTFAPVRRYATVTVSAMRSMTRRKMLLEGGLRLISPSVPPMSLLVAALWGLIGAAAIEAWDLYVAIHRVKGFPWNFAGEVALIPYLVSIILRVLLGIGMAIAFVASGQADGPVGVVAIGIAAPKILEQLTRQAISPVHTDSAPQKRRAVRASVSMEEGSNAS